ncbi:MAG: glycogen/starch/alpha-glucan phosphorylase, partial [Candidatus Syntrophosphaera sp.]
EKELVATWKYIIADSGLKFLLVLSEEIGVENMFIFGMNAHEVSELKQNGYNPHEFYDANPELHKAIDAIASNAFSANEPGIFDPIVKSLLENGDPYCILADFASYMEVTGKIDELYREPHQWARKAIINIARMGKFSADRAIREYAEDIWDIEPILLELH